jgi:hypothetical protein
MLNPAWIQISETIFKHGGTIDKLRDDPNVARLAAQPHGLISRCGTTDMT